MPRILTQNDIDDFRSRLCVVAAALYAEAGHDGFNMRELAKRMGVSAMTPYRYFADKDEILDALRTDAFMRLADDLEQALRNTDADRLAAVADAYKQFVLRDQASYRLMFDLVRPRRAVPRELAQAEARVEDAIARAVPERHARSADGLKALLMSMLHGAGSLHLAGKLPSLDDAICDAVRTLTAALTARPAAAYRLDAAE